MSNTLTRRNFLSTAATVPAVSGFLATAAAAPPDAPELQTSTRIVTFLPPPEQKRLIMAGLRKGGGRTETNHQPDQKQHVSTC